MNERKQIIRAARKKQTSSNENVSMEPKWFKVDEDFIEVFGEDFVYGEYESMGYDVDRDRKRVGISWVNPLPKSKMSPPTGGQKFGASRGTYTHDGVDYGASVGTPLYAIKSGTVSKAGTIDKNCGTGVILNLDNGYKAVYCHMSNVNVSNGDKVKAGKKIGSVGESGHAEGPHLHLKIVNPSGKAIDNWSLIFSKL